MKPFKPGVSFSDFVVQDFSQKRGRVAADVEIRDFRRGWLIWLVLVLGFLLIGVRMVVLQLIEGGKYRVLADENRIKQIKLPAERADILDRRGVVLAGSAPRPFTIDGVAVNGWQRTYPHGASTAHVVGYLSEVGEQEVGLLKAAGQKYDPGELIGRMGLEEAQEQVLRGFDGGKLVEVDNAGQPLRDLGTKPPLEAPPLQTTLDAALSETALKALKNKKGAVVVSNPTSGEILALVSSPSFDPSLFVASPEARVTAEIQGLLTNRDLPMFNRAITGVYAPGSTFKMTTTVAAIESEKVKPSFTFEDAGVMTVAGFRYTNWLFTKRGATEGVVNFTYALTRSVDTFYYKVGELIGPETMGEWAEKFGFGRQSGIGIRGEVAGTIASPQLKQKATGERWFLGNSYHMAIGQGDTLTTPLQVNLMTNIVATGGTKCKPNLLLKQTKHCETVEMKPSVVAIVHAGMLGACSTGGTAFPFFDWVDAAKNGQSQSQYAERMSGQALPVVACKTGTAEYMSESGKMRTHAWLTAFAPYDKPEISVTVLLEGGGEGSNAAAPVVRQVMAQYFDISDTYPYDRIPQELGE